MHHVLWAPIFLDEGNSGLLGLYRTKNQKPFDEHDQAQLLHLLPYVAHAYRAAAIVLARRREWSVSIPGLLVECLQR